MIELHSALLAPGNKDEFVATLSACAGMPIPASSMTAVTAHLVVAAGMASTLFASGPAPEESSPAAVFTLPSSAPL